MVCINQKLTRNLDFPVVKGWVLPIRKDRRVGDFRGFGSAIRGTGLSQGLNDVLHECGYLLRSRACLGLEEGIQTVDFSLLGSHSSCGSQGFS